MLESFANENNILLSFEKNSFFKWVQWPINAWIWDWIEMSLSIIWALINLSLPPQKIKLELIPREKQVVNP